MTAVHGPLAGTVALVTGASRGLGAEVAVGLAAQGAQVVLVARTQGGLEETDDRIRRAGGAATLLPLDLTKPDEIDRLGPSLFARFGRLDVLAGCAASLGVLTPVGHIRPRDWTEAVAVNLTAAQRLIGTCAPLLLAAPAGRAAFVTAAVAAAPHAYWGLYGTTQAALRHLVLCWAAETRTTRLRVNLFEPGPMRTALRAQAFPGEDPSSLPGPGTFRDGVVALCLPDVTRHGEVVHATTSANFCQH